MQATPGWGEHLHSCWRRARIGTAERKHRLAAWQQGWDLGCHVQFEELVGSTADAGSCWLAEAVGKPNTEGELLGLAVRKRV